MYGFCVLFASGPCTWVLQIAADYPLPVDAAGEGRSQVEPRKEDKEVIWARFANLGSSSKRKRDCDHTARSPSEMQSLQPDSHSDLHGDDRLLGKQCMGPWQELNVVKQPHVSASLSARLRGKPEGPRAVGVHDATGEIMRSRHAASLRGGFAAPHNPAVFDPLSRMAWHKPRQPATALLPNKPSPAHPGVESVERPAQGWIPEAVCAPDSSWL